MRRYLPVVVLACVLLAPVTAYAQYTNFESHQIHPLEITPDGTRLLALNTPDSKLEVFSIGSTGALSLLAEVPVGLEPVSVRARTNSEAWVVNHVSDSISIVDLTTGSTRVRKTVKTDDEPTDVVFAGTSDSRAFVAISQRNRVDVYSSTAPSNTPLFQLAIDGEDPRALARNAAGTQVYAAVFASGNQTLLISGEVGQTSPRSRVTSTKSPYGGKKVPPPPGYNASTSPFNSQPTTSIIVKWRACPSTKHWCDDNGASWDSLLTSSGKTILQMPDRDVAIINASATTPSVSSYVTGVGTLNFGIAVNPATSGTGAGRIYVANSDARNQVRFEKGVNGAVNLDGHLVDTRLTIAGTAVEGILNLNPHIDYSAPITGINKTLSIGQPNGMAFNATGTRLYVAAIQSHKVAVIDSSTVPGTVLARIPVGEGPTGVALSTSRSRLYVLNRHENTISIVDTTTNAEILPRLALYNPEPPEITEGRKFFYDAELSSGRGDVACSTCHAFGDMDLLAWDLGDPTRTEPFDVRPSQTSTGVSVECSTNPTQSGCGPFHPLKGPQTTQSLRGISGTEPLHWRGDRANFQAFNPAFVSLLKRSTQLSDSEMNLYTNFILSVKYPPNPNRNLDDTLTTSAQSGLNEYLNVKRDNNTFTCNQCHALPTGTNGRFINAAADQVQQALKTPQLRNMYEKTGFSLNPDPNVAVPSSTRNGFGFVHDGATDSLTTFLKNPVFTFGSNTTALNNMIAFVNQFDTGTPTTVGYTLTFDGTNGSDATFNTLLSVLNQGKIDLVMKGTYLGESRGGYCTPMSATSAVCQLDRKTDALISASTLKGLAAAGKEISFIAVPVGSGERIGIDRDFDGCYDQDEIDLGDDPTDENDPPGGCL